MTPEQRQAVCDILKYIQRQPHAKHSAEGIARYWIFQQRLEERLDIAFHAIHFLVEKGILENIKSGASCYYRVNQKKMFEITAILEQLLIAQNAESSHTS